MHKDLPPPHFLLVSAQQVAISKLDRLWTYSYSILRSLYRRNFIIAYKHKDIANILSILIC